MGHDRRYALATLRNRVLILDDLRDVLPTTGIILEVACGSGEHVVHCARNLPSLFFQPSDPDPDARLRWVNGIELALWALANLPGVKILVTTGDTLKNVLPEVLGKILPKPYALNDLLRRVKYALAT
jgi:hypothetical protein